MHYFPMLHTLKLNNKDRKNDEKSKIGRIDSPKTLTMISLSHK